MDRRSFLQQGAVAGLAAGTLLTTIDSQGDHHGKGKFKLKYAPHFKMFQNSAGKDEIDQLKFAADHGFTAWEDNQMKKKPVELQEKIAKTMTRLNMDMGVFVAHGSIGQLTFTHKDKAVWDQVLSEIKGSVEVAKRVNAKWVTVVPGNVDEGQRARLAPGYQTANVIELLRRCSEVLEPHGIAMVLEPLNWYANHGGTFLRYADQAYAICKAVNSPSCKILFDIYHQQITEGNLITNIDKCWDEIGYFQAGDNPGRKEPGTGEINYRNVFQHIYKKSKAAKRDFIVGMEHGNSMKGVEGEEAVIKAYRDSDNFSV